VRSMFEHRKRGSNGGMMVVKTNSSGEIISPLSPMQPESPNTKEDCGLGECVLTCVRACAFACSYCVY
jgi:hypothetical protein